MELRPHRWISTTVKIWPMLVLLQYPQLVTAECTGIYEDKWLWLIPLITAVATLLWVAIVAYILHERLKVKPHQVRPLDPVSTARPPVGTSNNASEFGSEASEVKVCNSVNEWEDIIISSGIRLLVVHFSADWCEPSKSITPKVSKLAKDHADCVFVEVDVELNQSVATKCGVTSVPTFQCYREGHKVDEVIGANYEQVVEMLPQQT